MDRQRVYGVDQVVGYDTGGRYGPRGGEGSDYGGGSSSGGERDWTRRPSRRRVKAGDVRQESRRSYWEEFVLGLLR